MSTTHDVLETVSARGGRLRYEGLTHEERRQVVLNSKELFECLEDHFAPRLMDFKSNCSSAKVDSVSIKLLHSRVSWDGPARLNQLTPNAMALILQAYFLTRQGMDVNVASYLQRQSFDIRCAHRSGKPSSKISPCNFAIGIGKSRITITGNRNPSPGFELHTHKVLIGNEIRASRKMFNICQGIDEQLVDEIEAMTRSKDPLPDVRNSVRKIAERYRINASRAQIARLARLRRLPKPEQDLDAATLIEILERDFPNLHESRLSVVDGQLVLEMAAWVLPMALSKPYKFLEVTMDGSFNMEASRQLFFILVTRDENNCILPLGFALHRRKETSDYSEILQVFSRIYGASLQPFVAKMDGELAIHNAATSVFNCLIRQCRWHAKMARLKNFPIKYTRGPSDLGLVVSDRVVLKSKTRFNPGSTFDLDFRHLVDSSRDSGDYETNLKALKKSWGIAEKLYFEKHSNPQNQVLFTLAFFSDTNETSNDAEGAFSTAKQDIATGKTQRPSDLIGSSIRIATEANLNANALCAARTAKLWNSFTQGAYGGEGAALFPTMTKQFLQRWTTHYAQEMFLLASEGFQSQIDVIDKSSLECELRKTLDRLPTVLQLVAGDGTLTANSGADHVFLHFLAKWLNRPCVPVPVAIFKLHTEIGTVIDAFTLLFEEGAVFCTCGVPLRKGHPCDHMVLLFREKRIQLRPYWHFANRFWSPEFHGKTLEDKLNCILEPVPGSAPKLLRTSNTRGVALFHQECPWRYVTNLLEEGHCLSLIGIKKPIRGVDPSSFHKRSSQSLKSVLDEHYRASGESGVREVSSLLQNMANGPAKDNFLGFLAAILRSGDDVTKLASDCRVVYQSRPQRGSWARKWSFADAYRKYRKLRERADQSREAPDPDRSTNSFTPARPRKRASSLSKSAKRARNPPA